MTETLRNVFLVRSAHLNHQGHLFGGDLMAEIDTTAYCLLRQAYADKDFVTRASEICFDRPALLGDALILEARIDRVGTTSVKVTVTGSVDGKQVCSATMVYVNIDKAGRKQPILPVP